MGTSLQDVLALSAQRGGETSGPVGIILEFLVDKELLVIVNLKLYPVHCNSFAYVPWYTGIIGSRSYWDRIKDWGRRLRTGPQPFDRTAPRALQPPNLLI